MDFKTKTWRLTHFVATMAIVLNSAYFPQPARAEVSAEPLVLRPAEKQRNLLAEVTGLVHKKYDVIIDKMPEHLVQALAETKAAKIAKGARERIAKIKSLELSKEDLQQETLRTTHEAIQEQKREFYYQIQNLHTEQLDELSEVFFDNSHYEEFELEYYSAFTRIEKAKVIARALNRDLDHLMSVTYKRASIMNEKAWQQDLGYVEMMHSHKSWDKEKWRKVLLYAGIAIAAVGIISWGIAESNGKSRYDDRHNQLERDYQNLRNQLEQQYNELETRLLQEEMDYLNDNGFSYQLCATYEMPDSIICNGHNYNMFQGTKFCSVYCYKNTTTGQETMHEAPVCTSPFIPADCYDPSEYWDGYDDGYDIGYDDGDYDGRIDGDEDGADDGYDDGYDDGWSDGYDDGYDDGFSDGYDSYVGGYMAANGTNSSKPGYSRGYRHGLRDAKILFGANN
jgi:hypothetical protein